MNVVHRSVPLEIKSIAYVSPLAIHNRARDRFSLTFNRRVIISSYHGLTLHGRHYPRLSYGQNFQMNWRQG